MRRLLPEAFGATRRCSLGVALLIALGLAGCGGGESSPDADVERASDTSAAPSGKAEGLSYVALGDSWIQGAHCNGCRTFPQTDAEALSELLGRSVAFENLAGDNQPYFETPGGGGSTGLRTALQTDGYFRERVAAADIIVISTGPNDFGRIGKAIENGTCGGADNSACVGPLDRRWHRDFDAILSEIEELRAGQPTAIRLVAVANELSAPSSSPATTHRGWEAAFEALAQAMCDNAKKHNVVCVDPRPVLNGPDFEQPVQDTQESHDAVAELLAQTGVPELEE